ncbi:hypothetical protein BpHYR1_039347 [Brachionus plicatilis]|uniref:Uncharacterized protein n=1 Tax=Brachionus plicatilis TaxID=10195 RepID=A0A3M7SUT5_BRAPC|nr:hypothetical protein BpHYR1_039347 [Brachionus plicatilis]
MSENSFMLLSRTKGPLINVDGETSESLLQQTLANRAFFKSTPSLAPSIQSSINSYKNEYVFEPISQKPKSNPNLSAHQRELFTPDSLESTLSSCSLTDSDDENNIINRDKESLDEEDEHVKSKTDSGLSLSPQLTHSSSTSDDKHFDLDIDFETDEEICQLTENKNETSISILEKLDKINRLQQKINDINLKIKSIDMNSDDQNCDLDQQEKNFDENFRNRNNQTRMAIRTQQSHNFHDDQNNQSSSSSNNNNNNNKNIDDDDDDHIDFDQDNYDEYSDDEDEQNEDDYYTIVQQAQPIKKYASTGFLFNRFGSYLAPIEEAPEEMLKSSSNSSIVSTDSSDYLLPQSAAAYLTKKTSTSCFNLELRDKSETSSSDHSSNQATNTLINSTFNAVDAAKLVDHDLFWADVPDSSLFIEREEFVDSSSLIESLYVEKGDLILLIFAKVKHQQNYYTSNKKFF